jgi:hypothetical protein
MFSRSPAVIANRAHTRGSRWGPRKSSPDKFVEFRTRSANSHLSLLKMFSQQKLERVRTPRVTSRDEPTRAADCTIRNCRVIQIVNAIDTRIRRRCCTGGRATKPTAAAVDAVRPLGAGSDGATRRLAVWRRHGRSAVAEWDASADNPCRVRDAFGFGGNSPRKMKGRGANGVR